MKKRVGYFDIAKGIGIILVVIAHIEYMPLGLREYIVTFHMPAFFVISGMLMNLTKEVSRSVKLLLSHKFKRIMLPYFVFSLIYPLTYYLHFLVTGEGYSIDKFFQDLAVGISMIGVSVLWFLPELFFSELIVLIIIKNYRRPLIIVLTVLALSGSWFIPLAVPILTLFLWRLVYCVILVLIGFVLYPVINKVSSKPDILLLLSALMFVVLYFTGKANGIVDLHYIVTGNKLLYFLNAAMGSIALVMLSIFIEARLDKIGFVLQFFGRHSLFIMLTHIDFMILYMAEKLAFVFSGVSPKAKNLIFNLSATMTTLAIETILIIIWEKIKKCGILFVGEKIRSKE